MRWVLPLVVAVVLATGTGDPSLARRKRARPAPGRADDGSVDERSAAPPCGSFDPATRTLTWFDDDESYN